MGPVENCEHDMMDQDYKWPHGDTHFANMGAFCDYQYRNRIAFEQAMRNWSNWSQEPPMMTLDWIDTVIDIGAHAGSWSLPLSLTAEKVYAYEPIHHQILEHNVKLSEQTNIEVRSQLLSDCECDRTVWIRKDNSGDTGVDLGSQNNRQPKTMSALPLDSFEHQGVIHGIKIDVQGHELPVLKGARQTIEKFTPVICCELNQGNPSAEKYLQDLGYIKHDQSGKDWIWMYEEK